MSGATMARLVYLEGAHGQARHPPRHARPDDLDDPVARADARLRHLATAHAAEPGPVPGQSGLAVPIAVPAEAGRQVEGRVARHGEQSAGEVLPAHGLWKAAARTAPGALEARLVRGHQRSGGDMTLLHRLKSILRWIARRDDS